MNQAGQKETVPNDTACQYHFLPPRRHGSIPPPSLSLLPSTVPCDPVCSPSRTSGPGPARSPVPPAVPGPRPQRRRSSLVGGDGDVVRVQVAGLDPVEDDGAHPEAGHDDAVGEAAPLRVPLQWRGGGM